MIRYKDKIFEDYFINPDTAEITDKNGVVQHTYNHQGYLAFKGMPVHRIQAYTAYGNYESSLFDVHHDDGNPLNNALSNLILIPREIHVRITNEGRHYLPLSEEHKAKISAACKGKIGTMKGKHHSEEAKAKLSASHKGNSGFWQNKPLSEEHKAKISAACKGKSWFNNGIINKILKECPGEDWVRGRLKRNK